MEITGFAEAADDFEDFADGLDDIADDMDSVENTVAEETAEEVADDARVYVPVDTGRLQRSIFVNPWTPMGEAEIIAAMPYSRYVEYGTFPHEIEPSSETTYDEPYIHPGASPKPYLRPALLVNRRTMHRIFGKEMADKFRRNL